MISKISSRVGATRIFVVRPNGGEVTPTPTPTETPTNTPTPTITSPDFTWISPSNGHTFIVNSSSDPISIYWQLDNFNPPTDGTVQWQRPGRFLWQDMSLNNPLVLSWGIGTHQIDIRLYKNGVGYIYQESYTFTISL